MRLALCVSLVNQHNMFDIFLNPRVIGYRTNTVYNGCCSWRCWWDGEGVFVVQGLCTDSESSGTGKERRQRQRAKGKCYNTFNNNQTISQVNRIVDHILSCVHKSEFASLQAFWNHLSRRFFSRLNHDLTNTAHKLESTILRLYLINAHRSGRHDDVKAFFDRMGGVLQERRDWKEWFGKQLYKTFLFLSLAAYNSFTLHKESGATLRL